jgi:hypothetical protein
LPQGAPVWPFNLGACDPAIAAQIDKNILDLYGRIIGTKTPEDKVAILNMLPNSDTFVYVFDLRTATKLGLFFMSLEGSGKMSVIMQEYIMYRDSFDPAANRTTRFGIGVRIFIVVGESAVNIATVSIPSIAAQVQTGKLRATIRLQTLGISGRNVTEAIPMPTELTFTTLMQMYQAMDVIKKAIWDENTVITPQIIGVSYP